MRRRSAGSPCTSAPSKRPLGFGAALVAEHRGRRAAANNAARPRCARRGIGDPPTNFNSVGRASAARFRCHLPSASAAALRIAAWPDSASSAAIRAAPLGSPAADVAQASSRGGAHLIVIVAGGDAQVRGRRRRAFFLARAQNPFAAATRVATSVSLMARASGGSAAAGRRLAEAGQRLDQAAAHGRPHRLHRATRACRRPGSGFAGASASADSIAARSTSGLGSFERLVA